MQRQLLHSQKLESLGVLAGGIAHDFNNLLMVMQGNLELAIRDTPPSVAAKPKLEETMLAVRRAGDLTHQMLAFSGRGKFVVSRMDLAALVRENVDLFRAAIPKTTKLIVDIRPGLPLIEADSGQLQQIVMNLITNAAEAIGSGAGKITIATASVECDGETLAESRLAEKPEPGRFVSLEVTDTGCGMDEDVQQRLFDPFFTTKFAGRGLGMAALLGIVRGHKGAIFIHSEVDRGTTIRVLFPVAGTGLHPVTECARFESGEVGAKDESGAKGTVLVVDDEPAVRRVCQAMVERLGYKVLAANGGEEGVKMVKEHGDAVDAVILDLSMPGMDGLAAFHEMRREKPDILVVLSSGYSILETTQRFTGVGMAAFIQKPFKLDELRELLAGVLGTGGR